MVRSRVIQFRESFWFLPTVFGIVAVVLGETLVWVDRALVDNGVAHIPFLAQLSASGGRSILTAVGGSMLTVAGTTFSITISVLATTSSTYGPRLVRNFMADRGNQVVLAAFTSTFLYSIVVMRSVHTDVDGTPAFVPVIAVHLAFLLAIVDVAVLVYFIHHIASSVQVTSLLSRVEKELVGVAGELYPRDATEDTSIPALTLEPSRAIRASDNGYVQHVDVDALVGLAQSSGVHIALKAMPGDHVLRGAVLAEVIGAPEPAVDSDALRAKITVGDARTPHQDIRFALQQLTEVAVRGLASGTNDPYTAVTALDSIAVGLVPSFANAPAKQFYRDDTGEVRLSCQWPTLEVLVSSVFSSLRMYALEHPIVIDATVQLAERLLEASAEPVRRDCVLMELQLVRESLAAQESLPVDMHASLARLDDVYASGVQNS